MFSRRSYHSAEYRAHIASKEWRTVIRPAALERANHRCQFCGRGMAPGRPLHVHHVHYRNLGHERPEDLTVLCAGTRGCHHVADAQRRAAAGLGPPAKRKRSRRKRRKLGRLSRTVVHPVVIFVAAAGGLKLAAMILPHLAS